MTPKVVLVHERFTELAGSEHVVEELSSLWPSAPVHVPFARPSSVPADVGPLRTTSLDQLYRLIGYRTYAPLTPLMPGAFRRMRLDGADVVVISHHSFATQAAFATSAPTVAYVHSPARWAWETSMRSGEGGGQLGAAALRILASTARRDELAAVPRLTTIVANSTAVAGRIRRWWNRDSVVVHPPVDTEAFTPDPCVAREDFFLLAGRLVPYKRPEVAIAAANAVGAPLVVVGDGRSAARCRKLAGPTVRFVGRVPHQTLLDLQRRTRALLMPGVEDFGIVPVEAMACGTPVIALGAGGVMDTVLPGVTGELVPVSGSDDRVIEDFATALSTFDGADYDRVRIRRHAEAFSRLAFRGRMQEVVDAVLR